MDNTWYAFWREHIWLIGWTPLFVAVVCLILSAIRDTMSATTRAMLNRGWKYNASRDEWVHPSGAWVDAGMVAANGVQYADQAQHQALVQQFHPVNPIAFHGGLTCVTPAASSYLTATSTSALGNNAWTGGTVTLSAAAQPTDSYDTSDLMQASDTMEKFVAFMKELKVEKPLEVPARTFTLWLAYEAEKRETGKEPIKIKTEIVAEIGRMGLKGGEEESAQVEPA